MTTVYCNNTECKFIKDGMICDRAMLNLDEDGECEDFEDYRDAPEWQKVFWKRMLDRERNRQCRVECRGKEIEMGGLIFCIDSNSYYATLTEKETGLICGIMAQLNENADIIGKVKERKKDYSPLMELPIALYDEETRKFSYPEEERSENGK